MAGSLDRSHRRAQSRDSAKDRPATLEPDGRALNPRPSAAAPAEAPDAEQTLFVPDPAAVRALDGEPGTRVLARAQPLPGYELYLVEQWACARAHPTCVIATFTGQEAHAARGAVLAVPASSARRGPRLRAYADGLAALQPHARETSTPRGALHVTNLSAFPSALTVLAVPGGDVRPARAAFVLSEDLKRLGCSGRAGLDLAPPSAATAAKFAQLYRAHAAVPLAEAVPALVALCQGALVLFGALAPAHADGLLCDWTERAVRDWWAALGAEFYRAEPSDGTLGPTTVAALLGMLLGARNRLKAYGAPVAKDVFDFAATRRGIRYFQRWQKMAKTGRLDPETLARLHRVTDRAAAASHPGRAVSKAVRSTVADLSGKGGEMVLEMVRGGDGGGGGRAGMAEVETTDFGRFIASVNGERCRWLWHGKPRKTGGGSGSSVLADLVAADEDGDIFSGDEAQPGAGRQKESRVERAPTGLSHLEHLEGFASASQTSLDQSDREPALRKQVLKSVTGRMNDARSGLGRFRDAVGGRSGLHRHGKPSRDESTLADSDAGRRGDGAEGQDNASSPDQSERRQPKPQGGEDLTGGAAKPPPKDLLSPAISRVGTLTASEVTASPIDYEGTKEGFETTRLPSQLSVSGAENISSTNASSTELLGPPLSAKLTERPLITTRSTLSLPAEEEASNGAIAARVSRSVSFSVVDALLQPDGSDFGADDSASDSGGPDQQWAKETYACARLRQKLRAVAALEAQGAAHAPPRSRRALDARATRAQAEQAELARALAQRGAEHAALRQAAADVGGEERAALAEALREAEAATARLEYELGALGPKVGDVEDGAAGFERQVAELEERVAALEAEEGERGRAWHRRLGRLVFGGA